jgi:hypothetical protein|tara:strand:+ start:537 stop:704 length:168 start_codon:yes stop_codon:yes gene_type:complete
MYLKINSYQNKLKVLDHETIKKILFESLWTSDIDYEKLPKNLNALSFKISIEVQN